MNDPVIDEVRCVRREISDEVGSNLNSLIERYRDLDTRFEKSPLTRKDRRIKDCTGVADSAANDTESTPAAQ